MASMATAPLSNLGIPGTTPGILHPLLANKFRVRFASRHFGEDDHRELTMQIVRISADFKNKVLRFSVEQSITGEVLELMQDLAAHPERITVQAMDGDEGVISATEYTGLETVSHEYRLDYASPSECATHEVVMKFSTMLVRSIVPPLSHKAKE